MLREAPYHGVLRGTPGVLLEAPFQRVLRGTLGVLCEAPCHRVPRGTLRVPNMKQSEAPFRVPRGTLGVLRSQGHRVRSQGASGPLHFIACFRKPIREHVSCNFP